MTHFPFLLLPILTINPFSVRDSIALLTVLSETPEAAEMSTRVIAIPSHITLYTFASDSLSLPATVDAGSSSVSDHGPELKIILIKSTMNSYLGCGMPAFSHSSRISESRDSNEFLTWAVQICALRSTKVEIRMSF